jgi:phosphomevalonate kinase
VKLGLGSSAAGAVASAGAVFASRGHDLRASDVRERLFECALSGHAAVAPSGSGVDVVASTFGGFQRFERTEGVTRRALEKPAGLAIRLVWTGQAARTSDLVAKVRELEARDSALFELTMGALGDLAERFADAFERGDAGETVRLAGAYGVAMGALGDAAAAPIVEDRLARAARLAKGHGGAAKPCGAGGGDVAIAFFTGDDAANAFALACAAEGLHPIDVAFGATGVEAFES